jgi:Fe2+ transport system protein B
MDDKGKYLIDKLNEGIDANNILESKIQRAIEEKLKKIEEFSEIEEIDDDLGEDIASSEISSREKTTKSETANKIGIWIVIGYFSLIVLALFAGIVYSLVYKVKFVDTGMKDLLDMLIKAFSLPLGFVLGFYFKDRSKD